MTCKDCQKELTAKEVGYIIRKEYTCDSCKPNTEEQQAFVDNHPLEDIPF